MIRIVVKRFVKQPLSASVLIIGIMGFVSSIIYSFSGTFTQFFGVGSRTDYGLAFGLSFALFSMILIFASFRSLEISP